MAVFFNASFRGLHLLGFTVSVASLLIAVLFMERYLGLEPCPLCIIDRIIVSATALLFLLAGLHNPRRIGQLVYAIAVGIVCLLGVFTSGRHIWLQSLPPEQLPGCTPDLGYLVSNLAPGRVIHMVLNSAGECAEVTWTFLGLSIPQQTLLLFVALWLISVWVIIKCCRTDG